MSKEYLETLKNILDEIKKNEKPKVKNSICF